jgi:hypothetical protein
MLVSIVVSILLDVVCVVVSEEVLFSDFDG